MLGFAPLANATQLGLDSSPLGNRAEAHVGYAMWDFFPTSTGGQGTLHFSNHVATIESGTTGVGTTVGASDSDIFSATLTSSMNGTRTGSGARLLSGVQATANPYNMTINGTANVDITDFALQWKFTSPGIGAPPPSPEDFFTITLTVNGTEVILTPEPMLIGTPVTEGANTFNIYEWHWTDLDIEEGDTFSISATSQADHVSTDAIVLDAVPEPTTGALIGLGLGLVAFARRRK